MRFSLPILAAAVLLIGASSVIAEDAQSKLQAYQLAVSSRDQLKSALPDIDSAITQAKTKVAAYQAQKDEGDSSASILLKLFKQKLEELKKTKADTQSKIDQLQSIIDALKKDTDVGSQITASEALSQVKEKLQKASSILPKAP
jgi:septation ring formation regulator EzrA